MNLLRSKKFIIVVIVILALIFNLLWFKKLDKFINLIKPTPSAPIQTQVEPLKIVSTKPEPLEESTIPPDGNFEIIFNKPVDELKMKTSPEDLEYEAITSDKLKFTIKFKKPLELGSGVTFFVLTSTHTQNRETLDKEYVYHIKTVGYRGI